jgi:hypothetical protein
MANGPSARVEAGDRVPNDHGVGVHEHVSDDESDNALAFEDRGAGGRLAQPVAEAVECLGQLQIGLLADQPTVEGRDLPVQSLLPLSEFGHAPAQFVQRHQSLLVGHEQALDRGRRPVMG